MTEPLILSIDTSGPDAGLALGDGRCDGRGGLSDGRVDALRLPLGDKGQSRSEDLAACLARLLADRGCEPGDLAVIGAVTGPGSYTGLRSGLAFLRGLALARSVPAVAVGTLELLAWRGAAAGETALVVWPAGAERVIAATLRRETNDVAELEPARLLGDDELRAAAGACRIILTPSPAGAALLTPSPTGAALLTPSPAGAVVAGVAAATSCELREVPAAGGLEELARLVQSRWRAGCTQRASELLPVYVGQSTARPNRHRVAVVATPE